MIPLVITDLMAQQKGSVRRPAEQRAKVLNDLEQLGIGADTEFGEFFKEYRLSGVLSRRSIELQDLSSPTSQILSTTEFARDIYGLPEGFICLSSGEGDGFIAYSRCDGRVYDVRAADIDALGRGELAPKWDSIFRLMEWYLS